MQKTKCGVLMARANPWVCLGLAFAWLGLSAVSAPPKGFVPTLSQIVTSQSILHFLLLSATVFTAATVPRVSGEGGNAFSRALHVLRADILSAPSSASLRRAVRTGLAAGVAMIVLSGIIAYVVELIAQSVGNEVELQPIVGFFLRSAWPERAALLVSVVVLSPVVEELFFRYAMESSLAGTLGSVTRAAAYAALLFAGMHGTLSAFPPLLLVAAVCSLVYRRARNLAAPIAAHMLFNLVSVAIILCGGAK